MAELMLTNATPGKAPLKVYNSPGPRFIFLVGPAASGKTRLLKSYMEYHGINLYEWRPHGINYNGSSDIFLLNQPMSAPRVWKTSHDNALHFKAREDYPENVKRVWFICTPATIESVDHTIIPKRDWETDGCTAEQFAMNHTIWDPVKQCYNLENVPWDLHTHPDKLWPVLVPVKTLKDMPGFETSKQQL